MNQNKCRYFLCFSSIKMDFCKLEIVFLSNYEWFIELLWKDLFTEHCRQTEKQENILWRRRNTDTILDSVTWNRRLYICKLLSIFLKFQLHLKNLALWYAQNGSHIINILFTFTFDVENVSYQSNGHITERTECSLPNQMCVCTTKY